MNPLRIALALVVLATVASAGWVGNGVDSGAGGRGDNSNGPYSDDSVSRGNVGGPSDGLNPSNWLHKVAQSVPKVQGISFGNLVRMPVNAASTLLKSVYHNSYLHQYTDSLFNPNINEVKMYLITANGNVSIPLNNPAALKNYPQLANGELTIFITGYPSNSEDPSDPVADLIEAYRERYQLSESQVQPQGSNSWDEAVTGNLIVIDLGNQLNSFLKWITVDIKEAGKAVGQALVAITDFVPYSNIHLIGHSVGAHVAGVAATYFTEENGKQLRRVTGLDPSKVFTKNQRIQSELSRGVADFVDVIHSTSYGAGSETNGDADFYPNGAGTVAPGSNNIVDASLKAISYYSESVRPGNEKNFMAVECNSLQDYENRHCHGMRIPMGYNAPFDAKGDFILRVNSNAPYGRNSRILKGRNRSRSSGY